MSKLTPIKASKVGVVKMWDDYESSTLADTVWTRDETATDIFCCLSSHGTSKCLKHGFQAFLPLSLQKIKELHRKARPKLKQKPVSVNFLSSMHRFGSLNDKTPVDYQFRSDSGSFGAIFLTGPNPVINILLSPATNFRLSACASTSTNARLINWNKFVQKYFKPSEKDTFISLKDLNDE